MTSLGFDISHLLAGSLVLISLLMLYQDRLTSLINVFAAQAATLSMSVAWQAWIQGAPQLYITAAIALVFKALVIPIALHRIMKRLGIHREMDQVVGVGPTPTTSSISRWMPSCLMIRCSAIGITSALNTSAMPAVM